MTVREIIEERLRAGGFDGLYDPAAVEDCGCGCRLGDLMPCGEDPSRCVPGVLREVPEEFKGEADFWIGPKEKGGGT